MAAPLATDISDFACRDFTFEGKTKLVLTSGAFRGHDRS